MKQLFKYGDTKEFYKVVSKKDTAKFNGVEVHPYYSTFALARDAEWSSRLFVLDMKEIDELYTKWWSENPYELKATQIA